VLVERSRGSANHRHRKAASVSSRRMVTHRNVQEQVGQQGMLLAQNKWEQLPTCHAWPRSPRDSLSREYAALCHCYAGFRTACTHGRCGMSLTLDAPRISPATWAMFALLSTKAIRVACHRLRPISCSLTRLAIFDWATTQSQRSPSTTVTQQLEWTRCWIAHRHLP
jgi:hypothetical protein